MSCRLWRPGFVGVRPYPARVTTPHPHATLDISIGVESPARRDEIDAIRGEHSNAFGRRHRPGITKEKIDWAALGWQPRWIDDDTSQSVVAIQPSIFANNGAQEWQRFRAGAEARGELSLVASFVGTLEEPEIISVFGAGASLNLVGTDGSSVGGNRIALASPPRAAEGLGRADTDLARRIAGSRPVSLPWWQLQLSGHETSRPGGWGPEYVPPEGALEPLLLSATGEVVAAVWTSPDGTIRHYILPVMPSWEPVLRWLAERAVPEFVPSAARRARGSLSGEPRLQTTGESSALQSLTALEAGYAARHAELTRLVHEATAEADAVRDPLLYGTGAPLVAAVAQVLSDAGLTVMDLDEFFGGTVGADLRVSSGEHAVLVEVKGFSGRPGEDKVDPARKHLEMWPKLQANLPVEGIVLVVNHQNRLHPLDRDAAPFSRAEFVESLPLSVLSTAQLFDWWRLGEYETLVAAVLGTMTHAMMQDPERQSTPRTPPAAPELAGTLKSESSQHRSRWRFRRRA